jgi:hypothetical protein
VTKANREKAEEIRKELGATSPEDDSSLAFLETFAFYCMCTGCQEKQADYGNSVATKWREQLQTLYQQLADKDLDLGAKIHSIHESPSQTPSAGIASESTHGGRTHLSDVKEEFLGVHLRNDDDDRNPISLGVTSEYPESQSDRYKMLLQSLPYERAAALKQKLDPETGFEEIPRSSAGTLSTCVQRSLGPTAQKDGFIYIYRTEECPGYVKIGYSKEVDKRLKTWSHCCGTPTLQLAQIETVKAQRVESLIFAELSWRGLRRRKKCKGKMRDRKPSALCADCGVHVDSDEMLDRGEKENFHIEWFMMSPEDALHTVKYWVEWMKKHTPYTPKGDFDLKKAHLFSRNPEDLRLQPAALDFLSSSVGEYWASSLSLTDNTPATPASDIDPGNLPLTQSEPNLPQVRDVEDSSDSLATDDTPSKLLEHGRVTRTSRRMSSPGPQISPLRVANSSGRALRNHIHAQRTSHLTSTKTSPSGEVDLPIRQLTPAAAAPPHHDEEYHPPTTPLKTASEHEGNQYPPQSASISSEGIESAGGVKIKVEGDDYWEQWTCVKCKQTNSLANLIFTESNSTPICKACNYQAPTFGAGHMDNKVCNTSPLARREHSAHRTSGVSPRRNRS